VGLSGNLDSVTLRRGEYAFITPDEGTVQFSGAGTVFLATTQKPSPAR
jgi:mannose-6-phosphate isomerase